MSDVLASKTVRLLLFLSSKATALILLAAFLKAWHGYDIPLLTELFGFEGAMFAAVAAKNGLDNFVSYRSEIQTKAIEAGVSPF